MPPTLLRLALLAGIFPAVACWGLAQQPMGASVRLGAWHDVHAVLMLVPVLAVLLLGARRFATRQPELPPRRLLGAVGSSLLVLLVLGQSTLLSPWPDRAWLDILPPLAGLATAVLVAWGVGVAGPSRVLPPVAVGISILLILGSARALLLWVEIDWASRLALTTDLRDLLGPLAPVLESPRTIRNIHPFGHANYGSFAAAMLLPVAAGLALSGGGSRRWIGVLAVGSAIAWVLSTGSRAGVSGLAAAGLFGALLAAWQGGPRTRALALVALLAALALPFSQPRFRTMAADLASGHVRLGLDPGRVDLVRTGIAMAEARPWVGWGAGSTPLVYPAVEGPTTRLATAHQLHSTPVQVAADHGIPGVLSFSLLLIAGAATWWHGRKSLPSGTRIVADSLAASCVSAGVVALTDYPFDVPALALMAGLVAGLAASTGLAEEANLATPGRAAEDRSAGSRGLVRFGAWATAAWLVLFGLLVTTRQGLIVAARRSVAQANDPTLDIESRIAGWDRASRLAPTEPAFPQGKAQLLTDLATGLPAEFRPAAMAAAIDSWTAALAIAPADPFARSQRGRLLLETDPTRAGEDLAFVSRVEPAKSGNGLALARLRRAGGDMPGAIDAMAHELLFMPRSALWTDWRAPSQARFREAVLARLERLSSQIEATSPGTQDLGHRHRRASVALIRWWWTGALDNDGIAALEQSPNADARWLASALRAQPGLEPSPPSPVLAIAHRAWRGEVPAAAAALAILRAGRPGEPDPRLAGSLAKHLARPAPRFTDLLRSEPSTEGLVIDWTTVRPAQPILNRLPAWPAPKDVFVSRQEVPALLLVSIMLPTAVRTPLPPAG